MDLSAEDLAYVRTVFDGLAQEWVRFGRPMPATVGRARSILDKALTCWMSLERQEIGSDDEESDSSYIGAREAAELLGVTPRTVQRNAESYGGQLISGSWVFNREDIGA
jgi:hypothetical protein